MQCGIKGMQCIFRNQEEERFICDLGAVRNAQFFEKRRTVVP